jgi:hypothetical protein
MRYATGELDLFDDPPPREEPKKKRLPAQRPLAANTLESRPASDKDRGNDAAVLNEVKANGKLGITRNELHAKTGISIQTLSWSLGRLLKLGKIFRRLDTTVIGPKLRFVSRGRCYVVYADLYRSLFERETDHPPYEERRPPTLDSARRSA